MYRTPSLLDVLTGEADPEPEPKKPRRNRSPKPSFSSKPAAPTYQGPKNTRPPEVSERVWGLAEQWIEDGQAALGKRPFVNLPDFSKRLATAINDDRDLYARRRAGRYDEVNDIVARMIDLFWRDIEVGVTIRNAQFAFLSDQWDGLVDAARTSLRVRHLKAHGAVLRPSEMPKDQNPYLEALRAQKERLWLAAGLDPDNQEPPVGTGSESDSLDRFRTK